ncbi:dihydrolipoamide acetyltransferase family protein [Noviherbaspirillum sedimenti]|uniref:2-oxo acid dehydrogenase subunit E2 n=1 Tax=Noviherbaspirillum sedimenti TaxID=2320865 RepID=A0A3A3FYE0_9BURK|nr:dihydrolipoamide acetyltransferase family protein [Noviherbaspirillum sedimenti]RJG00641.1 2-oxo acid dehydrogenase subunit E2 [Noviherbaspirillum sedimenti]
MTDSIAPKPTSAALTKIGITPGSYDLIPLDGLRQTIANRMTESFRDVPHFPLTIDVEIDALLRFRSRYNEEKAEGSGLKVTLNDVIVRACAVALARVPEANASFTPDGIARHHHADIAVAVALDNGLITPILRSVDTKSLIQVSIESKDLIARARAMKLSPRDYKGGTFSISNLGMFGIRQFASILNQPHGCILSVGVGEQRPIVKEGQIGIATVMSLTLTCDHRVVDGAVGARLLQTLQALLETPCIADYDLA